MQTHDLVQQLIALPLSDRVTIAQALWQSIDEGLSSGAADDQQMTIQTASRRDAEMTSGTVSSRTHEEVMEAVHRALECG